MLSVFLFAVSLLQAGQTTKVIIKFEKDIKVSESSGKTIATNSEAINNKLAKYDILKYKRLFDWLENSNAETFKNYYVIKFNPNTDTAKALSDLNLTAGVLWAEANHSYPIHYLPNDSLYPQQWSLVKLSLPQAWDIEQGNAQIIVGIIDTGIDYLHPDLQGQLWVNTQEDLNSNARLDSEDLNGIDDDNNGYIDDVIGWDFTDAPDFPDNGDYSDPDNDPMDEFPGGHGTPVGGIVAANTNNITGIAGIAPQIKIMALRAGTASGFLEEDDVAEAIIYGVQNGCKVINMSFGDVVFSYLLKEAVEYGTRHGVLFVASSGNSGNNILQYPASYDETISVGATDSTDNLAPFSSFGSKLDLVAPGQEILSTMTDASYGSVSGTSFSAPMVSGVLALLWSHNPQHNPQSVKAKLYNGCTDMGFPGRDQYYGHGLTNAYHSLIAPQGPFAEINSPQTNSGIQASSVPIIGTAISPQMSKYILSYGAGETPLDMIPFYEGYENVFNDTLGIWQNSQLEDATYTMELKIMNIDGTTISNRVIIQLDRTPPLVDSLDFVPVVVENYYGYLIEIETDDLTRIKLFYRRMGDPSFSDFLISNYLDRDHSLLLTQLQLSGEVEIYFEVENNAGLVSIADNSGEYYQLDLSQPDRFIEVFNKVGEISGFGYFMQKAEDINGNGLVDVFGNMSFPEQPDARISHLTFDNGIFTRDIGPTPAFARDIRDVNGDGHPELLVGYGSTSSIFAGTDLPTLSGGPIVSGLQDFWAAKILDLNNDGTWEIIALHQNQWNVFKLDNLSDFSVTLLQQISNPSAGENSYGVPYVALEDLNRNGKLNLVIGDYDGDIIIYELSIGGEFIAVDEYRLPGVDATHRFAVGDFDGDAGLEIVVATKVLAPYIGESVVNRQYWVLSILELSPANAIIQTWQTNFHRINDQKNNFTGVSVADYDNDGLEEIFFTPYPRGYYIQYQSDHYEINGYMTNINTNAVLRLTDNQVMISGDSTIMVLQREDMMNRPVPPANFRASEAGSSKIVLKWNKVAGSDYYEIQRERIENGNLVNFTTSDSVYNDSAVIQNKLYSYKIRTVDSSFIIPQSIYTNPIEIGAENAPRFLSISVQAADQLLLEFSRPLGDESYQVNRYFLLPDSIFPVSALKAKGGLQVLLSFAKNLLPGNYQLAMLHLVNRYHVPFYPNFLFVPFNVHIIAGQPYAKKVEMLSKKHLIIYFNHPMNRQSLEDINNYQIEPDDQIIRAIQDSSDQSKAHLYLSGKNRMGSLGQTYYLQISGLVDIWGQSINNDLGTRFEIHRQVDNLEDVIVYPNPVNLSEHDNEIMFGNIPAGCEIFIYSANGRLLAQLKNTAFSGGVKWDLRNGLDERVASGVYIFVAQFADQIKMGKFVILR